jgi:hypothetical protein
MVRMEKIELNGGVFVVDGGACRQLSAKKVMSFIGHQRHAMRDTKDTVSGYEHADVIFDLSVDLSREETF